jgi:HAD superfamily hydrolase (TIGR01490 family)
MAGRGDPDLGHSAEPPSSGLPGTDRLAAAFFDLDKTLMEGSSAVHFARAAYKAGLVSRGQLAKDAWANLKFRINGSTDESTAQLKQRILDGIAGQPVRDLARLGPQVLAGVLPAVYPEVLQVAYEHQDAGRPAYIVTAASQELAEALARVLVLDGGIGMRSEVKDGVYTGRAAGPFTYREGKAAAIRQLAEQEGIDLSASYAYSDSESDLPMLHTVGHPVAVNPDRELQQVARDEGWQVMRFDKLARRLRIGAAVGAVALVGGSGGYVAARFRPRRARRGLPWRD